jgi:clan AA aspartic protease (TIGR02281 family)
MPRPSKLPKKRRAFSSSVSGLLICYARLKSKTASRVIPMVVDTGADCTTIPIPIALQLGLDPAAAKDHATIITASGLTYAPVVEIPVFAALGIEWHGFKAACHNLPSQSRVEGLLGVDFLSHFEPFQRFQDQVREIALQFWEA